MRDLGGVVIVRRVRELHHGHPVIPTTCDQILDRVLAKQPSSDEAEDEDLYT